MTTYKHHERRRHARWWLMLILLTAVALAVSVWMNGPVPPRKIILATGPPESSYDRFGKQYQERLGKQGLGVELVQTNGSVDNLERLVKGEVDLAFVQGGTASAVKDEQQVLRGLVALYREPLWVFCRMPAQKGDTEGKLRIGALGQFLRGKRIAIGPPGSGTEVLARLMLRENGLGDRDVELRHPSLKNAPGQLERAEVDAAFFVATAEDPPIKELLPLEHQGIHLLPFRRHHLAYARLFPYLKPITLPEGSLSLEANIPPNDTILVAPAAFLACRQDLHPEVIELVLKEAFAIHASGSKVDAPGQFPTLEGVDLPVDDTAMAYVKTGESYLARLLPYWALRQVFQLRVLLLPLLVVWLPYLKILPMLYQWRVNRLLRRHYAALRDLETAIGRARTAAEVRELVEEMDHLRTDMEALSHKVPGHLQDKVYNWRLHVSMVRGEAVERMEHLAAQAKAQPARAR
jgi:TRAP transporter TAXI family solute receptor